MQSSGPKASEILSARDACWNMSTTHSYATCGTAFKISSTCTDLACCSQIPPSGGGAVLVAKLRLVAANARQPHATQVSRCGLDERRRPKVPHLPQDLYRGGCEVLDCRTRMCFEVCPRPGHH